MTFILNLLHADYSLLVADRRAQSDGPITEPISFDVGGTQVVIHQAKQLIINGAQKIFHSKHSTSVIGAAGDYSNHTYLAEFIESSTIQETLSIFAKPFVFDHSIVADEGKDTQRAESGILTYFEPTMQRFFSCVYEFSIVHKATYLYGGDRGYARVYFTGSGGKVFKEDESKGAIERFDQFCKTIRSVDDVIGGLDKIVALYRSASAVDSATGEEITAVLATRENPKFVVILG